MRDGTPLYFLTGPTASGKTDVAHLLADRLGCRLLSVDAMMVYRRMNIGTAKPSPAEIKMYEYAGLDLVSPGDSFSTGEWIRCIQKQLDDRPTLAVGGTGLYFRALIDGLPGEDTPKPPSPPLTLEELKQEIRSLDPKALDRISDPENPRRLERATSWLKAGKPLPETWGKQCPFPIPVLRMQTEELNLKIAQRAAGMFRSGLLEETRQLLTDGVLDGTASQAIGYQEAMNVLQEIMTVEEATEKMTIRTRRYAKRQRTWFRNQMQARWVDIHSEDPPEKTADIIAGIWQDTGPFIYTPDSDD